MPHGVSRRSALRALGGLLAAGLLLPGLSAALLPTPASASVALQAPAAPKPKPSASPKGNGGGRPQASPSPSPSPTPTPIPTPTKSPAAAGPGPSAPASAGPVPASVSSGSRRVVNNPPTRRSGTPGSASSPAATRSPSARPVEAADAANPRRRFDQVTGGLASAASNPELPLGALGAMLLFLLIQNRIDKRDPKLALAHDEDAFELAFAAPVRRTDPPVKPRLAPRPRLRVVSRSPYYDQPSALPDHT